MNQQMPETTIAWNFFKYLVNQQGIPVAFYTIQDPPLSLANAIEELIAASNGVHPHQYMTT